MLREVRDVIRVPVDNYQLATLATIKYRSDIIESVDDNDEIEWTEDPYEFKSQPATEGSPLIDLIQIQGPPSLRQKLRALCEEFSDIFDTAVRAEPADIPPMSIKSSLPLLSRSIGYPKQFLDKSLWYSTPWFVTGG